MGYHEYQKKWTAAIGEVLEAKVEPTNDIDKYAMAVCKKRDIVGNLPKGKTGKFSKMRLHFLKSEILCICKVKVTGKGANFGDDKVLRIPCFLQFSGPNENTVKSRIQALGLQTFVSTFWGLLFGELIFGKGDLYSGGLYSEGILC